MMKLDDEERHNGVYNIMMKLYDEEAQWGIQYYDEIR